MSVQLRVPALWWRKAGRRLPKRMRALSAGVLAATLVVALTATSVRAHSAAPTPGEPVTRTFTFTYEVAIPVLPPGTGPIDIFVPLAIANHSQDILRRDLKTRLPGQEKTESRYRNRFWHGHLEQSDGKPLSIVVDYLVRRRVWQPQRLAAGTRARSLKEREELALFLGPNQRMPISGPLIDQVRAELPKTDPSPLSRTRAIYDYVIDTMEYKKVGTGWGNGDTLWACSQRYGNCTDFHALFISLARAEGIPARFEIGFPIPEDRPAGEINGYHCWTEVYLADVGWFPIDASEAWKHKERRDLYFGTQPADRLQFTVGRDLELGEGHTTGPLNYFIYPHVEVAGQRLDSVQTHFSFSEEVSKARMSRNGAATWRKQGNATGPVL